MIVSAERSANQEVSTVSIDERHLLIGQILQLNEKIESGEIGRDAYRLEREKSSLCA